MEINAKEGGLTIHQGAADGYEYSSFGYLEKRLNDEKLFPLYQIEDK